MSLIFSAFKTLTGQTVTVELKNDVALTGELKSVDQFLNFRLDNIRIREGDEARWPHLMAVRSAFIRGSVVRYVHVPAAAVDTQLLEDATRREAASGRR
ncbi:U6 snRNA-associated Sm-like protein LSm2 [Tilletiopsis washingtonensis]|uniref:U6 snRNA-associated Sm-like protein LSm2 n=1 Tax=Tilletiopsis washingtonensis TaxID=58919 RepID=A0A316Z3T4_9BASI|nr:U6 snRNA-associated Sm-like protein LSm2 [Tilletiopsis washingtonensis]PWN95734.1 U6 snRNA-associated Sm-like protein LSm2 [Tilletiopsis washingtonensis]